MPPPQSVLQKKTFFVILAEIQIDISNARQCRALEGPRCAVQGSRGSSLCSARNLQQGAEGEEYLATHTVQSSLPQHPFRSSLAPHFVLNQTSWLVSSRSDYAGSVLDYCRESTSCTPSTQVARIFLCSMLVRALFSVFLKLNSRKIYPCFDHLYTILLSVLSIFSVAKVLPNHM